MYYGLTLPTMGPGSDARTLAELAHEAEAAGWDGVFVWDNIYVTAEETYDPWIALAAIAMRTERIRLGTLLTAPARRRPWKLARETVTLDHLSYGRLTLAVGLGLSYDGGFDKVREATAPHIQAQRLDESLDILSGLWSGQPYSYSGRHYQLDEMTFLPTPFQSPRIPIWFGTWSWTKAKPLVRAARWDGICIGMVDPNEVKILRTTIESQRSQTTEFDIVMEGETPGTDPHLAQSIVGPVAEAGVTWWVETVPGLPRTQSGLEGMRTRIRQGPPRIA